MENELVWLPDSGVIEAKVSMRNHPVDAVQVATIPEGHELDVLVAGVRRATAIGPGRFALPISWNQIVLEFAHADGQRSQYSHCVDCTPDFLFKGVEPIHIRKIDRPFIDYLRGLEEAWWPPEKLQIETARFGRK